MALSSGTRSLIGEAASWLIAAGIVVGGLAYFNELRGMAGQAFGIAAPDDQAAVAEAHVPVGEGARRGGAVEIRAGESGHYHAEVEVNGGSGNDMITANYSVEADGRFRFRLTGGDGNDTVNASLALAAGSTGEVEAEVDGNDGDDRLTLNVTGRAGSLDARLNGNDGFDRGASTPNVRVQNVEAGL